MESWRDDMLFYADKDDVEMVRCSNLDCCFGAWFLHVDDILAGDLWCSDECRETGWSIFCHCRKVLLGPVLKCANDDCPNGSQYHVSCINITCQPGTYFLLVSRGDSFITLVAVSKHVDSWRLLLTKIAVAETWAAGDVRKHCLDFIFVAVSFSCHRHPVLREFY